MSTRRNQAATLLWSPFYGDDKGDTGEGRVDPGGWAEVPVVMAFADKIPPQYLWCRDMAHAWDPGSLVSREVFNRRTERWEIWRTVACLNCPSHKTQKLTKSYQILRTDYDKPPDYSITGDPRITAKDRAQIRARSTALRGGAERTDRKATRKTGNITPIRTRRRRA